MKNFSKICLLGLTLMTCLTLSGCSKTKEVENQELSITFAEEEYAGLYTGTLVSGQATGAGTFTVTLDDDSWEYQGDFVDSQATEQGSFTNLPASFKIQDTTYQGLYSGKSKDGLPSGQGSFTITEDHNTWNYEGTFSKGKIMEEGQVREMPYSFSFQENIYLGLVTGATIDGLLSGHGEFNYQDDDVYLTYQGDFSNGNINGNGQLQTNRLAMIFSDTERIGTYDGDCIDGIPEGQGVFSAVGATGSTYTYTGEWKNGKWDGQGTCVWDNDDPKECYTEYGTFIENEFTPTFPELLKTLGSFASMPFRVSERSNTFLEEHANLFPTGDLASLEGLVDGSVEFKQITKNPENYDSMLIQLNSHRIIQINEGAFRGTAYTRILVQDNDYNVYYVYYLGQTNHYDGDRVTIYGLPIDTASYDNIGGGITNTVIVAGALIQ